MTALKICCYGNSLTAYPDTIAALRPNDTIVGVGSGNQYTAQMLTNFTTDIVPFFDASKRNICIFWEGVDSIDDHGVTPSQELAKLKSAATLCHANNYEIIVAGILPCRDTTGTPEDRAAFNKMLKADHAWADCYTDMAYDLRWNPSDPVYYANWSDPNVSVHLTTTGYTLLGNFFNAAIDQLINHGALISAKKITFSAG